MLSQIAALAAAHPAPLVAESAVSPASLVAPAGPRPSGGAVSPATFVTPAQPLRLEPPGDDVPRIEVFDLPDSAITQMTAIGPVIFYDPVQCEQAGAACEFFFAHEEGHVRLGHLVHVAFSLTPEGHAAAEAQADCYAARTSSAPAVSAVVKLILAQPPSARDLIYGTGRERVRRILSCSRI